MEQQGAAYNIHVLAGRLDAQSSDAVSKALLDLLQSKRHLIVDCAELRYVSSVGLRVLLVAAKQAAALKVKFLVCALTDNVRQIFDLAGFSNIISLCPTRNDAVAALS